MVICSGAFYILLTLWTGQISILSAISGLITKRIVGSVVVRHVRTSGCTGSPEGGLESALLPIYRHF